MPPEVPNARPMTNIPAWNTSDCRLTQHLSVIAKFAEMHSSTN